MKQPKTFVITLSPTTPLSRMGQLNKDLGEPMLADLLVSLKRHGWEYELFPAQDGYLMSNAQWQDEGIQVENHCGMRTLSGAVGCLYSHLQLWKKCIALGEPIVILEHDVVVLSKFSEDFSTTKNLVKLGRPFPEHVKTHPITGQWRLGAWGYWINPEGARTLIEALQQHGTIPTDVLIGSFVIDWDYIPTPVCELNHVSLLQSSTSLRNERRSREKWTNPFMTTEELIDWLEFVFKKRNLKLVFEFENKFFKEDERLVSDVFTLAFRNADNLIVQSISSGDIYELDVKKIKELECN
jgi:GR25 family glycosyltransferase involved in LPS biosynthesis